MTILEFEEHRRTWVREWNDKWRVMDIDFETYMIMKDMSPDEYKRLNESTWVKNELTDDDWTESFI